MKNFSKAFLFLFVLLSSFNGFSQALTSSPYSRFGLGDLNLRTFGQGTALAGTSLALRTNYHLNPANPASLTAVPLQTFILEVGLTSKFTGMETNTTSDNSVAANIAYFGFAFPVTKWMGMSFGFMPYSTVGYKITNNQNLYKTPTDIVPVATSTSLLQGSGGLTQYYLSTGIKPFTGFSIGASIYALLGTVDRSAVSTIVQDSSTISIMQTANSMKVRDVNYSLGFQYEHLWGKTNVCIAAVLDNKKEYSTLLTGYRSLTVSGAYSTVIENDTISKDGDNKPGYGKITLPTNLGLGLSLSTDKILLAFDYYQQDWSQASFFGVSDNSLATSHRYSMGFEYTPDYLSARYWKFVRYKAGAYFANSYVQMPIENGGSQPINEYGFSLGLDLPLLNKSFTVVCPSFQFGSRGTTSNSLVKEKFFIFHLNFTMNDRWFVKRKID